MQPQEQQTQVQASSSTFTRLIRFIGKSMYSSNPTDKSPRLDLHGESDNTQAFCGGYNDAFIVQYWTSYNPRD